MRYVIFALMTMMVFALSVRADEVPAADAVRAKVAAVVQSYITAIACETPPITAADVITLSPWTSAENRPDAAYAVVWSGSIGCGGGNGTYGYGLAVATVGAGDTVLVDPYRSSPMVTFDSPTQNVRVVGSGPDSLVLEGKDYAADDPRCCPSLNLRMTVKRDAQGNWRAIKRDPVGPTP